MVDEPPAMKSVVNVACPKKAVIHNSKKGKTKEINPVISKSSESEATIYKRAVQQIAPELEDQISQFISQVRSMGESEQQLDNHRKESSSSKELMDISDETRGINGVANINFFADRAEQPMLAGPEAEKSPNDKGRRSY